MRNFPSKINADVMLSPSASLRINSAKNLKFLMAFMSRCFAEFILSEAEGLSMIKPSALVLAMILPVFVFAACGKENQRQSSTNPVIPRTSIPEKTVTITGRFAGKNPLEPVRQPNPATQQAVPNASGFTPAVPQTNPAQPVQTQAASTKRGQRNTYFGLHLIQDDGRLSLPLEHEASFTGAAFTFPNLTEAILKSRGFVVAYKGAERYQKAFWSLKEGANDIGELNSSSTFYSQAIQYALENTSLEVKDFEYAFTMAELFNNTALRNMDSRQIKKEMESWALWLRACAMAPIPVDDAPAQAGNETILARRRFARSLLFLFVLDHFRGKTQTTALDSLFKCLVLNWIRAELDRSGWGVARARKRARLRYLTSLEISLPVQSASAPGSPGAGPTSPAPNQQRPGTPGQQQPVIPGQQQPGAPGHQRPGTQGQQQQPVGSIFNNGTGQRQLGSTAEYGASSAPAVSDAVTGSGMLTAIPGADPFSAVETQLQTMTDEGMPNEEKNRTLRTVAKKVFDPESSLADNFSRVVTAFQQAWKDSETAAGIPFPFLKPEDVETIRKASDRVIEEIVSE